MSSEGSRIRLNRRLAAVRAAGKGRRPEREEADAEQTVAKVRLEEAQRRVAQERKELRRKEAELDRLREELESRRRALDEKIERLGQLIDSVQKERIDTLASNEEEIVSFTLSITEKVLQYEVDNGRYKIGEVVKGALEAVREKSGLVVHVNPGDFELAGEAVERLRQVSGVNNIETVADESVPPAACCIETKSGKVFSEIPNRLKRIESSLLKKNGDGNGV